MPTGKVKQWVMTLMIAVTCVSFLAGLMGSATATGAPITGQVWLDLNGDGIKSAAGYIEDSGYTGTGAKVIAYDADNNSSEGVFGSNGNYSIDVSSLSGTTFRVELSVPSGYTSAPMGSATDSTVRQNVAQGASNTDFAIEDPAQYCSSNPRIFVSCFTNGSGQIPNNTVNATSNKAAIKAFPFNSQGYPGGAGYSDPSVINTQGQVGTIYGLGYSKSTGKIYESAFLRRHAGFGPGGTGAIYEVNPNTGAVGRTITIADSGSVPSRDLAGTTNTPSHDANAFGLIGKNSLGDLDVVDNGNTLFVTNLNTRKVVRVDALNTPSPVQTPIDVPSTVTCPGGLNDRRVFGLGSRKVSGQTKLYVGVTCTGETNKTATQLSGDVLIYDVATNSWQGSALTNPMPLNYTKGCALKNNLVIDMGCAWKPWSDNYLDAQILDTRLFGVLGFLSVASPQPIISDIQFDQTGAMVLGIADRGGWQWGHENYSPNLSETSVYHAFAAGDQLRACPNSSGAFLLESNASCGGVTTTGSNNNQGPGNGEFYWGDSIIREETTWPYMRIGHDEVGLGAFAFVPGRTAMIATVTDPFFTIDGHSNFRSNSVGVAKLSHTDDTSTGAKAGGWIGAYELGMYDAGTNDFAKAGGLGDLEVLCDGAPVELGNYVWFDLDKDGIQDPGEVPLEGVSVSLQDENGTILATAKTNAQGRYLFASEGVGNVINAGWDTNSTPGDDNPNDAYGIVADPDNNLSNDIYGIKNNTNYKVIFDKSTVVISSALTNVGVDSASELALTNNDADGSQNGDKRDSDADDSSGNVQIVLMTGIAGDNNHTFDVGFYADPEEETTTSSSSTTSTSTSSTTTSSSTTSTSTSSTTTSSSTTSTTSTTSTSSTTTSTTTTSTTTLPTTTSTTTTTTTSDPSTTTTLPTSTTEPPTTTSPPSVLGEVVTKVTGLPLTGAQSAQLIFASLILVGVGVVVWVIARTRKDNR